MNEVLLALLAGLLVGVIFRLVKLPVPVPNALAGIMGIIGMFIASVAFDYIVKLYGSK